jgi:hypothetical protein
VWAWQITFQLKRKCGAVYRQTVPVHEVFRGQTVWRGEVEVFDLNGHHKAKLCYAWSHQEGPNNQGERFVAVLEIPPVNSAKTTVRASIIRDSKPD